MITKAETILRVACIQTHLFWEDVEANLAHFDRLLDGLTPDLDLVVLPEMFTTGFSMRPQHLAALSYSKALLWLEERSRLAPYAICGSVAAEVEGKFYNRFLWAYKGEVRAPYDKRHLFRMAGEHEVYSPGVQRELIEFKGWHIMPRICYDLRFPVWSRGAEAHVQIYVANWPSPRVSAWDTLLQARAIENVCYSIGVNRVGEDGNGVAYPGHSAIIDYMGKFVHKAMEGTEQVLYASLVMDELLAFRQKFPVQLDADRFRLEL